MSSQTPDASVDAKAEGSAVPESNATATEPEPASAPETAPETATATENTTETTTAPEPEPKSESEPTTATAPAAGISKETAEIMNGIVRYLTEYRNEEYVSSSSIRHNC